MKKFIKSILLFIPFSIILYVFFIVLWGELVPIGQNKNIKYQKGSPGHLYSRVHEIEKFKDIDILFLGASKAYRGFDVRYYEKLGLKVFNLGSSSQTPIQTQILLQRYLDKLNPKMVIYATPDFYSDGVESSLDLIANDKKDFLTVKMMARIKNLKTINTGIFGFYRDIFNCDKGYCEDIKKENDTYISGGFVAREISFYSPSADKNTEQENRMGAEVAYQKESFEKIIDTLNKREIEVILVNTPIVKKYYSPNENLDNYLKNKANYYDFNKLLNLDDSTFFYDAHHLNQNGVKLFNEKIIDTLKLEEFAKTHN